MTTYKAACNLDLSGHRLGKGKEIAEIRAPTESRTTIPAADPWRPTAASTSIFYRPECWASQRITEHRWLRISGDRPASINAGRATTNLLPEAASHHMKKPNWMHSSSRRELYVSLPKTIPVYSFQTFQYIACVTTTWSWPYIVQEEDWSHQLIRWERKVA